MNEGVRIFSGIWFAIGWLVFFLFAFVSAHTAIFGIVLMLGLPWATDNQDPRYPELIAYKLCILVALATLAGASCNA